FTMSDNEDRGERKRKSKKSKHKKEKKSRRDRPLDEEKGEEVILATEPSPPTNLASQTEADQLSTGPPPTVASEATVDIPSVDPSTSNEKKEGEDDDMKIDPWIPFDCSVCKLNAKCYYRELRCSDGYYSTPVYFMRDPFTAPPRVRGRKPVLNDYVVIGALCEICSQPSCLAKSCTLHFGAHFCSSCVLRERRRFPEKLVEGVAKACSALSSYVDPAIRKEEKNEQKEERTN
ncbi:hypothetical protein PMAYCL1PPCAC_18555, partial [Pristionchus mayeri]